MVAALVCMSAIGVPAMNLEAAGPAPSRPHTMTISTSGKLDTRDATRIVSGARYGGARGHVMRFASFEMTGHSRAGRDLLRLRSGWRIAMATKVAEADWVRAVAGSEVVDILASGRVAIGETAAAVRGAREGDILTLHTSRFARRDVTIGVVVEDRIVDSGDLLMLAPVAAEKFGFVRISGVSITGIASLSRVLGGLKRAGIVPGTKWRLRTSWDDPSPDGTLGLATVKKLFGEVRYRPTGGAGLEIDRTWALENISWQRRYKALPLRNNCHKVVAAALEKALAAIVEEGLGGKIDVANSNRYGGCYTGRFNRLGSAYPSPSRHAFGLAVDLNPSSNPMWGEPTIDCRIVRIMREHGFAWGGNFWPPDGMHFEWVGEPRHLIGYPSQRCRNAVPIPTTTLPDFAGTTTVPATTTTISSTTVPAMTLPESTTTTPAMNTPTTTSPQTGTTLDPAASSSTSVPPSATSTSVASGS